MILFIAAWFALMPYYTFPSPKEIYAALNGLLLVVVGWLLKGEIKGHKSMKGASLGQRFVLRIFPILIVPSSLVFIIPNFDVFKITEEQFEIIVATTLIVMGYLSIYSATKNFSLSSKLSIILFYMLLFALSIYSLVEIWYTAAYFPNSNGTSDDMSHAFVLAFATLKLVVTFLLVTLVTQEWMTEEDRELPFVEKMAKFFGFGR